MPHNLSLSILFSSNSECSLALYTKLQLVNISHYIFTVYSFLLFKMVFNQCPVCCFVFLLVFPWVGGIHLVSSWHHIESLWEVYINSPDSKMQSWSHHLHLSHVQTNSRPFCFQITNNRNMYMDYVIVFSVEVVFDNRIRVQFNHKESRECLTFVYS